MHYISSLHYIFFLVVKYIVLYIKCAPFSKNSHSKHVCIKCDIQYSTKKYTKKFLNSVYFNIRMIQQVPMSWLDIQTGLLT